MPTLSLQPGDSIPIPKKECLKYCIIPFEVVLDEAAQAEAYIEFDGTAYAAGIDFVFAGFTFTTSAATTAFDRFPFTGVALTDANAFIDALNLNALFFGFVTIVRTQPVPGTYRVTVTWNSNGDQPNWDFDFTGGFLPAPPPNGETNGGAVVLREGFKLRYQLFAYDIDDNIVAVTDMESVTPRVTLASAVPRMCFDFMDDVKGLVGTTWPGLGLNDIQLDEAFRIRLFLKYGGIQIENCEVTEFDFLQSDTVWLVNSAFQIDDEGKFTPYHFPDTNPPRWLTVRPTALAVRSDAYYWLWIYCNHITESAVYDTYRVSYDYLDSDGVSISTFTSPTEPTEDGVYIVPCGPMNSPGIPGGTAAIVVLLQVWQNVLEAWVDASTERTVTISDGSCKPTEFHFIEDLGAYSLLYASEPEEIIHNQENQVFELGENCPDDIYARDHVVGRVLSGGRSRANIRSYKRYRCEVMGYDTAETQEWFRQFRDSEDIKHRYATAEGITVMRNIILEADETVMSKEGEYLTMSFVFRYHTDLR
jgi:hypothetical protein